MKNDTLLTRNFVLTSFSKVAIFTSFYFLLVTLPIYILQLGGTKSQIGLVIGVFTISSVVVRPFMGREVDKRGRKNMLLAGSLVVLLSMLVYTYVTGVTALLLLRVFHGFVRLGRCNHCSKHSDSGHCAAEQERGGHGHLRHVSQCRLGCGSGLEFLAVVRFRRS